MGKDFIRRGDQIILLGEEGTTDPKEEIYERPKIWELDQVGKCEMWLGLEVLEQGTFPNPEEVYLVLYNHFAQRLGWDRKLQAIVRERVIAEVEHGLKDGVLVGEALPRAFEIIRDGLPLPLSFKDKALEAILKDSDMM